MNIKFLISLLYCALFFFSLDSLCPMADRAQKEIKALEDDTLEMIEEIYRQIEDLQDEIVSLMQRKLKFISQVMEAIEDRTREKEQY